MTNTEQQARELLVQTLGGVERSARQYISRPGGTVSVEAALSAIKAALERTHNPDLEGLVERLRYWGKPNRRLQNGHASIKQMMLDAAEALSTIQPPAIEDERGKIVAWLRGPGPDRDNGGPCRHVDHVQDHCSCRELADAIERGEHSDTPSPLNGDVVEALNSIQSDAEWIWRTHDDCCGEVVERSENILSALNTVQAALGRMVPASGDVVEALKAAENELERCRARFERLAFTPDAVDVAHTLERVRAVLNTKQDSTDYLEQLARALFEASYQMRLRMWSDDTRAYWLKRARVALSSLSSGEGSGE